VESGTINKLASSAPHLLVNLLIVLVFVGYLDSRDGREDLVATQRIQTCHSVSAQGVDAMLRMSTALNKQSEAFNSDRALTKQFQSRVIRALE
jgi:hypothetical protein